VMDPALSYNGLKLSVKRGDEMKNDASVADLMIKQINHFAAEMDDFASFILEGRESRTPGEMGPADMRILAANETSLRSNQPARLG
jgi:predicted dehydrogenase